jgi:hypothetical protein
MNSTFSFSLFSALSNVRTYSLNVLKNVLSTSGGVLSGEGCVAISQDGQGVGTEPMNRHSPASANGLVVNHSHMKADVVPALTESINPRMSLFTGGGKELDRRRKMDGRGRTLELEIAGWPALLHGHHECHSLTTTPITRDSNGRIFQVGDGLVGCFSAGNDGPAHGMVRSMNK